MRVPSLFWKMSFICLILGTTQGCDSEELEFEPTDLETTSEAIINQALDQAGNDEANAIVPLDRKLPDIPGMVNVDEFGNCIIDGEARTCPDIGAEVTKAPIIPPELEKYANDPNCKSEEIDLILALDDALTADDFRLSEKDNAEFTELKDTFNLKYSYEDGKEYLNGMELTDELSDKFTKFMDIQRNHVIKQIHKKRSNIIDRIVIAGFKFDNEALEYYRNSNMPLQIKYDKCKINDLLKIPTISGIETAQLPTNSSLGTAMQATGIAQAMNSQPNASYGNNTGVLISDENCASPNYLSNYLRLDNRNPSTNEAHIRNIASIIRAVSPNSYIYCREWCGLPTPQDLQINSPYTPRIAVAAFPCNYCGTHYQIYDREADNFIMNHNIPFVTAAGNTTKCSTYVQSYGKGLNVNTVGNYNDNNNTPSLYRMHPTSCYVDPETHNFKPELSAPGTNIYAGINTDGTLITDPNITTGTSQATAHVAGLLANIASGFSDTSRFTAALARARLLASASDVKVYNPDGTSNSIDRTGWGGAHYSRLKNPSFYTWFEGNYNELSYNDPYPYNNAIDQLIQIGSNVSLIRLYFVWLNSGTWTYEHRYNSYPMGRRFTLYLYDPYGNYLSEVTNLYTGVVHLYKQLNVSGTYHIKIVLSDERDTTSRLRTALVGYYY